MGSQLSKGEYGSDEALGLRNKCMLENGVDRRAARSSKNPSCVKKG